MERLKSEIYYNMEEKYNELKKAESLKMRQLALLFPNSAILMNCWRKWDFPVINSENHPVIENEEAMEFISLKEKTSYMIATGVGLILLGVHY